MVSDVLGMGSLGQGWEVKVAGGGMARLDARIACVSVCQRGSALPALSCRVSGRSLHSMESMEVLFVQSAGMGSLGATTYVREAPWEAAFRVCCTLVLKSCANTRCCLSTSTSTSTLSPHTPGTRPFA